MRRFLPLSVLCIAVGIASACNPDSVIKTDPIPTAGVRFINAVPDTSGTFGMDFRFIDIVESDVQFRVSYRNSPPSSGIQVATGIEYKDARAGSRHFRVFLDDTIQSIASTVLKDSTVTLEAGHNYTMLLMGNARSTGSDKMQMKVIDETVTDPGALVALRVINATNAAIDASEYPQGGAPPAGANWPGLAPYSVSGYITSPVGPIMYNVKAAGGAALFADLQAAPGALAFSTAGSAGKIDIPPVPGTLVAGSAVTLIVFPRSVPGTKTPQTAPFQVTAGAFTWDRRPPNPPGT